MIGLALPSLTEAGEHHHHAIVKKETKHQIKKSVHKKRNNLVGIASWYGYESGPRYKRKPQTANGDIFSPHKLTAAHRSLPFGTKVKVTNLTNNKSVIVVINDRGPFHYSRIIDLSKSAAKAIGIDGIQKVSLTVVS